MSEQIKVLEDSLRTNIAMCRAMTVLMHFTLARRYLANAHKDKRKIAYYKTIYNQDATQEYKTI